MPLKKIPNWHSTSKDTSSWLRATSTTMCIRPTPSGWPRHSSKANKRFDFLLLPGQRHGFGNMTEYFFWKMGDYFCERLLGDYNGEIDITEINKEVPRRR